MKFVAPGWIECARILEFFHPLHLPEEVLALDLSEEDLARAKVLFGRVEECGDSPFWNSSNLERGETEEENK